MAFGDTFRVRASVAKQRKGDIEGAKADYQQYYDRGLILSFYLIPWSILLLREGGQENLLKVKEILVKAQKAPDLNPNTRSDLLTYFAVAQWLLGEKDKAVELMERVHQKSPMSNTYTALGYMYIDTVTPEKALEFCLNALEYDDEDPVLLDNVGQTYYRALHDPEKALPYFKKAIEIKDTQVDTLWFLSRYDLEAGDKAAAIEKLERSLEGRFAPLNYRNRGDIEAELARLMAE
ncbi:MAG: hypothetical protein MJ136_01720 [Clostridia bacterium]|nr:hypothetical protein [Clostridia bacterium]